MKAILKDGYSPSSHHTIAYDDVAQEMQEKKIRPKHKLYWVVRLKWECMGATTIIKRDYKINYVNVDLKGRQNRPCNWVLIVQVERSKEHVETEAEVDVAQISLFGAFNQSSHKRSGNPPSPPPQHKSPQRKISNRVHKRSDNNDDDDDKEQFP